MSPCGTALGFQGFHRFTHQRQPLLFRDSLILPLDAWVNRGAEDDIHALAGSLLQFIKVIAVDQGYVVGPGPMPSGGSSGGSATSPRRAVDSERGACGNRGYNDLCGGVGELRAVLLSRTCRFRRGGQDQAAPNT